MIEFEISTLKDIDRVMTIDNEYQYEKYSKDNFIEFYSNKFIDIIIAKENSIDLGYAIIMSIFDECNLINYTNYLGGNKNE